jgi:hypothetical protein
MGLLTLSHWDAASRNCRFCGHAVNARTDAGRLNLALFGNPDNPEPLRCDFFCVRHAEWTEDCATCGEWRDPATFNASTSRLDARPAHRRCG